MLVVAFPLAVALLKVSNFASINEHCGLTVKTSCLLHTREYIILLYIPNAREHSFLCNVITQAPSAYCDTLVQLSHPPSPTSRFYFQNTGPNNVHCCTLRPPPRLSTRAHRLETMRWSACHDSAKHALGLRLFVRSSSKTRTLWPFRRTLPANLNEPLYEYVSDIERLDSYRPGG